MKPIRAVIFDLDGVIVSTDEQHYQGWLRLAQEEGIPFDRNINERLRGVSRAESLAIVLERSARTYSTWEKTELAERKNRYYRESIQDLSPSDILDGGAKLIAGLKAQAVKIAIASSSKNALPILKSIGLDDAFDAVVTGHDIERTKPDPAIFILAARQCGVPPEECLVIEDAVAGVEGALNAGMRVLAVGSACRNSHATARRESLAALSVDEVLGIGDAASRPFPALVYELQGQVRTELREDAVIFVPKGGKVRFLLSSGGCWYGHGFAHRQPYPLNAEPIVNRQFAVNNIQSPIWMCSSGCALLANTTAELDVRSNEKGNGWLEISCAAADFKIQVFRDETLPKAHQRLLASLGWPSPAPDQQLLGDSIFCTWTQYPRAITQQRILEMAKTIRKQDYPCSTITIDDRWESVFGELTFSPDFPNPRAMMDELHNEGFRVLLWVTPFVNREAFTFPELAGKGWLTPAADGNGPALIKWWGGTAGLIDLSNPEAREWYRAQLLRLKNEVGVDGFKIDGGDAKYQPAQEAAAWFNNPGPSGYVDLFLALAEEVAPGLCESRTAWLSQRRNVLWREGGKDSHWGIDNGLQAMVTLGLHLGLLGYDLMIPDMIPGRVQTLVSDFPLPSDELFIRWTEASALMPMVQFSYFPWNYADTTADIARAYARLHKSLEDYLHRQASGRKAPLLRPLWYDHPEAGELYSVADEFLLGGEILVAPVLTPNTVARDIVLPPGAWRDAWTGEVHNQPRIPQYPAPCPGIPIFIKAENAPLFETIHNVLKTIERGSIPMGLTTTSYRCGLDRDIKVTG